MEKQIEKLIETLNKAIEGGLEKMPAMAEYILTDISNYHEATAWNNIIMSAMATFFGVVLLSAAFLINKSLKELKAKEKSDRYISYMNYEMPIMFSGMFGIMCFVIASVDFSRALTSFASAASPIGSMIVQ